MSTSEVSIDMSDMERAPWERRRFGRVCEGKYRHQIAMSNGSIYRAIRHRLGLSQSEMANRLGIKLSAYQYRERVKSMYYPLEFAVLHDLSQLPPDEFINILYDIA